MKEKERTGIEGGAYVYLHDIHVLFSSRFRFAWLASTKAAFEEKSNSNIWHKRIFFRGGRGISILEYVSGASRMGINWKTSCPRWKIIFMELSGNSLRMDFIQLFLSLWFLVYFKNTR